MDQWYKISGHVLMKTDKKLTKYICGLIKQIKKTMTRYLKVMF